MSPRKGETRKDFLARQQIYNQKPEVKARLYHQKPEYKAKKKIYDQKPEIKAQRQSRQLKAKYGITLAEKEAISKAQNHRCSLCGLPQEQNKHGELEIDHCHETNIIRGMLCHPCNLGLGHFKDDPNVLEKAAAYIRKHRAIHGA